MGRRAALALAASAAAVAAVLLPQASHTLGYAWQALTSPERMDWSQVGRGAQPTTFPLPPPTRLCYERASTAASACLCTLQAPPWPLFKLGDALASRWLPQLQAALLPPHVHVALLSSAFVPAKGEALEASANHVPHRSHPPASCSRCHVLACHAPAALYAATRLGVADMLHQHGPLPAAELAARLGVKEDALARVLRCLAAHGVFREARPPELVAAMPKCPMLSAAF